MGDDKKHYYNNQGVLDYFFDDNGKTSHSLCRVLAQTKETIEQRSLVSEVAMKMIYEYTTFVALSQHDISDAYFKKLSNCDIEKSLTPIFKHFVQSNYIPQEFLLVANACVANMQFDLAFFSTVTTR